MSSPDLRPDRHLDKPHYRQLYQLYQRFRDAIATEQLQPGDRVPSIRSLASELNLSRGTVGGAGISGFDQRRLSSAAWPSGHGRLAAVAPSTDCPCGQTTVEHAPTTDGGNDTGSAAPVSIGTASARCRADPPMETSGSAGESGPAMVPAYPTAHGRDPEASVR